jgi:hypothetical protein
MCVYSRAAISNISGQRKVRNPYNNNNNRINLRQCANYDNDSRQSNLHKSSIFTFSPNVSRIVLLNCRPLNIDVIGYVKSNICNPY